MKHDAFLFLEIFGNIDEKYIEAALQPFPKNTQKDRLRRIGKWAACLVLAAGLLLFAAHRDQVSAAMRKFTAKIAEILQFSNDIHPYTDPIGQSHQKDGITIFLEEVLVSENQLYASIHLEHLDGSAASDFLGVSASDSVCVNGQTYPCLSSGAYRKTDLDAPWNAFVLKWTVGEDVPLQPGASIDLGVQCYSDGGDTDGTTFPFSFTVTQTDLQKTARHINLNQQVKIGAHNAALRAFNQTVLSSSITLECENLCAGADVPFLELTDANGKTYRYFLEKRDGNLFTFQTDVEVPSFDCTWLDARCYILPFGIEQSAPASDSVDAPELVTNPDISALVTSTVAPTSVTSPDASASVTSLDAPAPGTSPDAPELVTSPVANLEKNEATPIGETFRINFLEKP